VGQQVDRFDDRLGLCIDDRDGAVQQIGHVGLLRIGRHGGGNRNRAGREDRIDGIVREIVLGGVGRKDVRRHHLLAVVAHPMGVWVTATDVDSSLNAHGHGSKFHDRVVIRCPVHRNMDLIRIDSGHHVSRRLADGDIVQQLASRSVEHRELTVEPLRLINHGLVFIRPEIVRIVHIDARKGDLSGGFPGLAADGGCRSRLGLASGFFKLCINPDFSHRRGGWIRERSLGEIVAVTGAQDSVQIHDDASCDTNVHVGIGDVPGRRRGVVQPVRRMGCNEKGAQQTGGKVAAGWNGDTVQQGDGFAEVKPWRRGIIHD
jgi:hypothetical protein